MSACAVQRPLKFEGGSLMVGGGCMMWKKIGYICEIVKRVDEEFYTKILEDELQASIKHFNKRLDNIIF